MIFVKGNMNMGAVTNMCAVTEMGSFGPILFLVAYLGIVIYLFSLLTRFVRAIEKIATKIENSPRI